MTEINLLINDISNKTSGQEYFSSSKFTDTVRPVMGHIELDVPALGAGALGSCPRSANSLNHLG